MRPEWEAAVRAGDVKTLERLEGAGFDVDALDRYGQTGLMLAATEGHTAVVRALVARGAKLNHTAKYHLTALMLAVLHGHVEVVRELASAGADLSLRGSGAPGFHGKTALELAEERATYPGAPASGQEIARILREASSSTPGRS
jgi:ankyrin repeat protein